MCTYIRAVTVDSYMWSVVCVWMIVKASHMRMYVHVYNTHMYEMGNFQIMYTACTYVHYVCETHACVE